MSSYTGEVEVGGPVDVRELPGLTITKIATNPFNNNCYLLRDTATGDTLLVDAAGDPDRLLEALGDGTLIGIVTTHGHWDHWQGLDAVVQATGAPVLATAADAGELPVPVDRFLADGDTVTVGAHTLEARTIAGHTPGSVSLFYPQEGGHLFTGDCLFPGGVGNTEKDAKRFASLLDDVETKLFGRCPDSTWVYPGHGGDTTLGAERPSLAEWRERGW
ncbi:MAG: hydroxyacylglutathione hydrolase [Frankiales bacterium]|nr:hydroxyacylglutathione hydrolase [Frankiales bacterium]